MDWKRDNSADDGAGEHRGGDAAPNPWAEIMEGGAEEQEGEQTQLAKEALPKEYLICLVDVRSGMLDTNAVGVTHLHCALSTVASIMKLRAQSAATSSSIGVVFVGGDSSKNMYEFEGVEVVEELKAGISVPVITGLKTLGDAIVKKHKAAAAGGGSSGSAPLPLGKGLWVCTSLFQAAAKKFDTKRVFIFSNDDAPGDKEAQDEAVLRLEKGVELLLWPIQRRASAPFDVSRWWAPIVERRSASSTTTSNGSSSGSSAASSSNPSAAADDGPEEDIFPGYLAPSVDGTWDVDTLLRRRTTRKRVYARVPFSLAPGVHIAVGIYNTIYPAKRPTASKATASGEAVTSTTRYVDAATGGAVEKYDRMKFATLGRSAVAITEEESAAINALPPTAGAGAGASTAAEPPFSSSSNALSANAFAPMRNNFETSGGDYRDWRKPTRQELEMMRALQAPAKPEPKGVDASAASSPFGSGLGLLLLGFKPRACVRVHECIQQPIFLYPLEAAVLGSTSAFVALWRSMLQRGVVAICRLVSRVGATPRIVALWAVEEERDAEGEQASPAGMYAIHLPYADDVRSVMTDQPATPESVPSDDAVEKAREVIRQLQLGAAAPHPSAAPSSSSNAAAAPAPFSLAQYEIANPVLQKFYRGIESLALKEGREWDDARDDSSAPNTAHMQATAGEALRAFQRATGLQDRGDAELFYAPKRPAPKKKKLAAAAADDDGEEGVVEEVAEAPADEGIDWRAELAANGLKKRHITVDALKAYCARHDLPRSGKKDALLERVRAHLLE